MKKAGRYKKIAVWALLGSLTLGVSAGGNLYARQQLLQQDISGKVLRFHVLANSDSKADQALKLKVRDAVGCFMQERLASVKDLEQCRQIVEENLDSIQKIAVEVMEKEGYAYGVQAYLEETTFPVKSYGQYTFPAGVYEALRIEIGEGEGQNWWCVMYPNMCFSDSMYEIVEDTAQEELRKVLTTEEYEEILATGNYKVQFRYLSFLNSYLQEKKVL